MKKLKALLLALVTVIGLSSLLLLATSAESEKLPGDVTLENLVQFVNIEAEYTGLNGIRAVFNVKDSELNKLEAAGCTVSYGAIVGYRSAYPDFEDLTVDATENAVKIMVYENGTKIKKYFMQADAGNSRFAIATFFGSKAETEAAHRALVYRAFVSVTKGGNTTVYYVDGNSSVIGEKVTLYNTLSAAAKNGSFMNDSLYALMDRFHTGTTVYVDPAAAAGGDGLSAATALKTVKEGYEKAVALINASSAPIDVIIELLPGKHHITEKLHVKGSDITSDVLYSITFQGSKSTEKSIVTSSYDIAASEFTKADGIKNAYVYQLPESAKVNGAYPRFRDLYIDGQMATLATSQGEFAMQIDSCRRAEENKLNPNDRLLYVDPTALGGVEVDQDGNVIGTLEFWVQTDWQVHCVRIEHIDYAGTEIHGQLLIPIRVQKDDWDVFLPAYYSTLAGRRYWFKNNKAYLDEKGEFWYDEANGKIYMRPFATFKTTENVSYPVAERLFHLDGAKNISFKNLDFCGTTVNYITDYGYITGQGGHIKRVWTNPDTGLQEAGGFLPYGAIYGKDATDVSITSCSFYELGGDALYFRGAVDRLRIYDNSIENVGGCGIRLGIDEADFNEKQHNTDIVIRENFLQNIAVNYNSSIGILVSSVKNIEITHNTILDTAYTAISLGWRWNRYTSTNVENARVEYNYIENFMTKTQDGGAIYTLGGNAPYQEGELADSDYVSTLSHNYIVLTEETGNGSGHFSVLYHDQGSSHWLAEGNILVAGPDAQGTDHSYVSYQTLNGCTYNNKHTDMIFIGTQKEEKPFKNPVTNADGSITYQDPSFVEYTNDNGTWDTNNRFEKLYMYESFAALAGTPMEAVARETAEKAGCASYHPEFGEWSAR